MALRINHNITALDAWRNLTQTTRTMSTTMEKLSSGFRINRAADDPAGLVISEQFRAQIAGLNRAVQNSEGSINMIQTAEGALNEINNLLVSMRELAIHAANEGFNDTNQLAADQAEITNAIATITRIAGNTQFGTKKLLDGSTANVAAITTANSSLVSLSESQLEAGTHSITAVKLTESSATMDTDSFGLSNPTDPYNLSDGVHNIDVIQASSGAIKLGNAVDAMDAWGNGMTFYDTSGEMRGAWVTATAALAAGGETGLQTITFQLNFQESGSNPVGLQTLTIQAGAVASASFWTDVAEKMQTAINTNTYLAGKIIASADADQIQLISTSEGTRYSIATGSITSTNATVDTTLQSIANRNDRGISRNELKITANYSSVEQINVANLTTTMDIASGEYTTLSSLVTAINTQLADTAAFGTYDSDSTQKIYATVQTAAGLNYLKFYGSDEGSKYSIKIEETGDQATSFWNAVGLTPDTVANTGVDAIVRFDGFNNSINEVRYFYSAGYDNDITLYTSASTTSRGALTLDYSAARENGGVNVGNMLLTVKARTFRVQLDGGTPAVITAGEESTVFNSQRDQSIKAKYGLKSDGGTEQLYVTDQSLVFQIGANVGQTAKIGIPDLSAEQLGKNLDGNMFNSLADISVMTAEGAQDAQAIIDQAINEVTNIRGKIGSFQKNTLESNLSNLRIAAQNLTASEASIRDTDMAKTMSDFVKNQILLQAGTAMLAQGNQMPQVVLSLFQ